jgi:hypothetical protein
MDKNGFNFRKKEDDKMRELMDFRFRYWDQNNKKLLYIKDFLDMDCFFRNYFLQKSDAILMEWCGLRDINENNIFEGDIIKVLIDDESFILNIDSIYHDWVCNCYLDWHYFEDGKPEIIGNIFENQELLEEK